MHASRRTHQPSPSSRLAIPFAGLAVALLTLLPVAGQIPGREPVRARKGMVASSSSLASKVGVEVMRRGGNAVDAAVAVGLALAVTHPSAGNLGGGGFSVIRMADGRTAVVDFRETAPSGAREDMYRDRIGKVIPEASTVGARAVGVPGTVAGLGMELEKWGSRPWREVIQPAVDLAEGGFPVSYEFARDLRGSTRLLSRFPESQRIFLKDGKYYAEGETFRQADLARTLRRLRDRGPREFYTGETADLIQKEMRASGGLITKSDLARFVPVVRQPLRGTYRGCEIVTMPPPSSGGAVLLEMLNTLERFDLPRMQPNSAARYHLLVETMRRAYADRAEWFGDPAYVKVPVAGLTSKRYADTLFRSIDPERATPSQEVHAGQPLRYESPQTTHYSVVDAQGNAVSTTYTLNGAYGCGLTVRGAGFLLNNEMDDFTSSPGTPNQFGLIQGKRNAIAAGKRPLSSMTPTIVLKGGKLYYVIGSPGGPTIINTVLQVTLNVIDHGMNLQRAIDAPRIHHQWLPDVISYEPLGLSSDTMEALRTRGHVFTAHPRTMGDAEGVLIDPASGVRLGASDPRNPDAAAVGY